MVESQLQIHGQENAQAEPETGDVSKIGSQTTLVDQTS